MKQTLVIGNKNYSSWSLRPWVLLKEKDIPFEELLIPLYQESTADNLAMHSPSMKVPALKLACQDSDDLVTVWDSLAICEVIAENYPEKKCWPILMNERFLARSISCEMHSGFFHIRNKLPMNCRTNVTLDKVPNELQIEIGRVVDIWRECLQTKSERGDFLFGEFTIADAMFAPVVLRFESYGVKVGEVGRAYMNAVLSLASVQEWINKGRQEKDIIVDSEWDTVKQRL